MKKHLIKLLEASPEDWPNFDLPLERQLPGKQEY